jgi:hypothetical protein
MSDPPTLVPRLPESFDGFRLELDPERQRADVILDRPPLNIVTMAEREELRAVFETLDAGIRVVVLRGAGEHFRAVARSRAFSTPRPSTFRTSPGTSPPRRAAASRSLPPTVDIALASVSNWRWPAISASSPRPASIPCPSSVWDRSPDRVVPGGCKGWSASLEPRTSSCARAAFPAARPMIVSAASTEP